MPKPRRTLRALILFGALAILTAMLALRTRSASEALCEVLRHELPGQLGMQVAINDCELEPLTATLTLRGLALSPAGAPEPLFAADEALVSLQSLRLTSVQLDRVTLTRPRLTLDLSSPAPSGADPADCPLRALQRAQVNRLEVKGANVRVKLPDQRQVEVTGLDLGWKVRRGTAEFQLDASGGGVQVSPGRELLLGRVLLEGSLDVGEERLELTRGEVALDEARVSLTGRVESLCDPTLTLGGQAFLPMSTVAKAIEPPERLTGHLWSRISLTGRPAAPVVQVDLVGSELGYGNYAPGEFTARLALAGRVVTLSEFSVPAGAGTVRASGTLRLERGFPVRLNLETENASFGAALGKSGLPGAWVDFPATARASVAGPLLPALNLTGEGELRSGRFQLTGHPYGSGSLEPGGSGLMLSFGPAQTTLKLGIFGDRVELGNVQIVVGEGSTRVGGDVTLYFDPQRGLLVSGRAEAVDLADFGHIAGLDWSGKGSARFQLQGPYDDLSIDSQLALRDFNFWGFGLGVVEGRATYRKRVLNFPAFSGQKGKTQYFGQAELDWAPGGLRTRADVAVPAGRSSDLVDVIVGLHSSIDVFQGTLDGAVSGAIHVDGPAERFQGTVELHFKDTTYYGRRLGDGKMGLRFVEGSALVLDKTVISGPLGEWTVEGRWAFAGPLDYRFKLEGGSLAEVVGPERAEELGLAGELTLSGRVEGDSTTPVVTAYLTAPKVAFGGKDLGAAHLEGRILGREMQLWGRPFGDGRARMKVRLRDPWPFEGSISLSLPEIRPLLPEGAVSQGVTGSLSGAVAAQGTLRDVSAVKASATLEKLAFARGDFAGMNVEPIVLGYEGGRLTVENFGFKGPNTELSASGWYGPDELDLSMRGAFDMRLLESFVPSLERTGGKIEVQASASGPVRRPSLVGSAEVKDVRLSLRDQPYSVRSLSGRVEFSEARVLVQEVLGIVNEGRVAVRGDLRLAGLAVKAMEVQVALDEVSLRPMDYLPLTASGELLLTGTPEALQLSGGVDVVKLRYEQPLELASLLKDVRQGRLGGSGEKPKEWLRFDVDIAASGDVRVDNNLARARLGGKLKLVGTNVRPGLLGAIEAAEGSQAFYRGNQFAISRGELQFKDRDRLDALVDLNAQTQVREYLVTLKAFGRLSDPKVLLASEPALSEADILSLLTLGVTSRDQGVSSQAGAGLAAEALFAAVGLDRQVQRFLPKNALLRDLSFHLSTTYNEASGLVEPTAQLESKFLTDRLRLGMTQPVSGRGTRALAEYQFNDRLSARAQWDNENQEYSFGNPGLDLKLRWELE